MERRKASGINEEERFHSETANDAIVVWSIAALLVTGLYIELIQGRMEKGKSGMILKRMCSRDKGNGISPVREMGGKGGAYGFHGGRRWREFDTIIMKELNGGLFTEV